MFKPKSTASRPAMVQTNVGGGNAARVQVIQGEAEPETDNPISSDTVVEVPPAIVVDNDLPATPAPANEPELAGDAPAPTEDEPEDPRFKGKSKRDIYRSYAELEKRTGEMGNELGRYRKLFDEQLDREVQNRVGRPNPVQAPSVPDEPEDDAAILNEMLGKPKAFMQKIEQRVMNKLSMQSRQTQLVQTMQKNSEVIQDPGFADWLRTIPPSLNAAAGQDPEQLQFVVDTYRKLHTPATTPKASASNVRQVSVGAAGHSGTAPRSAGQRTAKFSLKELAEIRQNDPDRYWSPEIQDHLVEAYEQARNGNK